MIKSIAVSKVTQTVVALGLAVSVSFTLSWVLPGLGVDLSPLSTAWAQTASTPDCDADGDGYILDSNKCQKKNRGFPIDDDDSDCTTPDPDGCPPPPPDSGSGTPTCYIENAADTAGTISSAVLNDGLGPYENGVDLVTCDVGDVINGNTLPLRFRSVSNGNVAQAIRFVDLAFDSGCQDLESGGCAALPPQFFRDSGPSEESIDFEAKIRGLDVAAIPSGESRSGPFALDVQGYVERYAVQLMAAPANPGNFFCWDLEAFNTISGGDPDYGLNIYAWADTDGDGRPNGYTVTTGDVSGPEDFTTVPPSPPEISQTGPMQALVCSNVGADGSPCAAKKDKNKLCHTLAIVDMYFTAHYIVP